MIYHDASPRLFHVAQQHATSDDYYTPAWVFERMGITFDLDVCAPPGGVDWVPATRFLTVEDDGLAQPWSGRVWMNPPFSYPTPWIDRFITHANGIALFIHSKAHWCGDLWCAADGWVAVPPPIMFVGANNAMPWPMSMAAFGDECVDAIARIGTVRRLA